MRGPAPRRRTATLPRERESKISVGEHPPAGEAPDTGRWRTATLPLDRTKIGEEEIEMRWGLQDGDSIELEPEKRYLINPGSVGQPRDGNPKASCLTLDLDAGRATWHRVEYAIEEAQRQILKADLPHFLAERLGSGL